MPCRASWLTSTTHQMVCHCPVNHTTTTPHPTTLLRRPWKGSWRWFHEELLDCCLPLNKVAQEGVVLTQVIVWGEGGWWLRRGVCGADMCGRVGLAKGWAGRLGLVGVGVLLLCHRRCVMLLGGAQ
jgi:hypothetical protein